MSIMQEAVFPHMHDCRHEVSATKAETDCVSVLIGPTSSKVTKAVFVCPAGVGLSLLHLLQRLRHSHQDTLARTFLDLESRLEGLQMEVFKVGLC